MTLVVSVTDFCDIEFVADMLTAEYCICDRKCDLRHRLMDVSIAS